MGQGDPTYGRKVSLRDKMDPYGTKGSYLWDKGILKGLRDPYGTKGILFMGQKGSLWDKGILFMGQGDP